MILLQKIDLRSFMRSPHRIAFVTLIGEQLVQLVEIHRYHCIIDKTASLHSVD
jgi:hypothetical protein